MEAAGLVRVVRAEDVAHMGITEVLRHMPRVFGAYTRLVATIKRERPDVAILIDFPDVNFRLAKHCKRLGIPVVWFVSPQLWAWKRRRLRWVQQRVAKMLVIFPFEEAFYRARGVDAEFVGHPLAALPLPAISREEYAAQAYSMDQGHWWYSCGLDDIGTSPKCGPTPDWAKLRDDGSIRYTLDTRKPWIALLPGSRIGEITGGNLWDLVKAAYQLGNDYEYLIPIAQTITDKQLNGIRYFLGDNCLALPNPPRITLVQDARAALYHSRAAIVASGTATVQALTIGNPFLVVYRVSRLTFALARRLVRYPAEIAAPGTLEDADGNLPIAMPNLIAGRRIVPEFLNERFTAANLAAALRPLLEDGPERAQMIADLAETRAKLLPASGPGAARSPIERVCDAVESLLESAPAPTP
jgi:lipid-A-disaccharide synthase